MMLTGGTFLDGYILGIVGPVSGKMTAELAISPVWDGLIAAGAFFGILIGSQLGGWAGDKSKGKSVSETASGFSH
ncbi:hypothetical protein [Burkholderia sp. Bp8998]|uniref:hypothetical protein n=1 Tax=Burkholderia sp. Bp8998 TaxID=2184557 RepID=UPI0021AB0E48|nr:hypothetical protein [Burkholderia sp. Bp8998]